MVISVLFLPLVDVWVAENQCW